MAFVSDPNQQQNQPGQGQPGQQNPLANQAPVSTSSAPGAGPGTSVAGNATGATASNQAPAQPFANLQAYLTANAPQIAQEGQNIAGQLTQGYGQVQNDINAGTNTFQSQVSGGYAAPNADLVGQAVANPTQFASDPTNVANFQAQLNDQYTGPQNFEGSSVYSGLAGEANQAAQNANLLNSPSGIQTYFQGLEQNPTPGDTTLDQALLSASPGAIQTVQAAAQPSTQLPAYLQGLVPGQDQSVQGAITAAQQAQTGAQTGLNTASTSFSDALAKELSQAQGNYTTYNQDVGQLKGTAQDINSQIQAFLAANPNLTNAGGNDYLAPWENLGQATNAPSLQNVATGQDYATDAALSALAGNSASGLNLPINQSTANQAGTFALPQDLQAAIENGAIPQAMTQELQGFNNQIQGAYAPLQQAESAATNWQTIGQPAQAAVTTDQRNIASLTQSLNGLKEQKADPTTISNIQAQLDQANADLQKQQALVQANPQASWDSVSPIAQGLQWLTPASQGYNDLVSKLQADLTGISKLNVPQAKAPMPQATPLPQQAGNAAGLASGVAGTGAGAAGTALSGMAGASAANAAIAAGQPVTQEMMVPANTLSGLGPLESIGPAALAAYGTSNIVQNEMANPVQSGLANLANTGLSLATLSLPPQILQSLGKDLQSVINSIGNFFKGLF